MRSAPCWGKGTAHYLWAGDGAQHQGLCPQQPRAPGLPRGMGSSCLYLGLSTDGFPRDDGEFDHCPRVDRVLLASGCFSSSREGSRQAVADELLCSPL